MGCFVPLDLWLLHLKSTRKGHEPVALSRPLCFAGAQGLSSVLCLVVRSRREPCWNFWCFVILHLLWPLWSSSVKWAQPWVLLGGFLGIELYNDSKELVTVKSKGTQASVPLCLHCEHKNSFKISTFRLFPFTKPCGPSRGEHSLCFAHIHAPEVPSS